MNFDHAFIVTYGRSGSTLLQGVLNAIPGAMIRGENGNVLFMIQRIEKSLGFATSFAAVADVPTHPWFGADRIDAEAYVGRMVAQFVDEILQPPPGTTLLGFKEIRHTMPREQMHEYLDFLRARFSRAALIVNTRDMDEVIASNQVAGHAASAVALRQADADLRDYAAAHPEDCFQIDYADYAGNPDGLRPLFDFLGAAFDADAVAAVLDTTHSFRSRDLLSPPLSEPASAGPVCAPDEPALEPAEGEGQDDGLADHARS